MTAAPLDLTDPAVVADPYPAFARARAQAPVQWHEGLGLWLAFTHAESNAVLRDRRLGRIWQDKAPAERFESFNLIHRNAILEMEPPAHTRLRRLISSAFARGHVERLRPWVEELARTLRSTSWSSAPAGASRWTCWPAWPSSCRSPSSPSCWACPRPTARCCARGRTPS
ncbi:cytochrome P450 [Blastococcus sp. TML/C7B]|uniref:cytochrome P450 n=1 Tax=Blastococcus sp. TML/C7B TaxID=2798728 RepID=UPI001F5BA547|nr:cytochrome P450 [Blastococcus sp. TML/C7B]